jgi:hypothetical protein
MQAKIKVEGQYENREKKIGQGGRNWIKITQNTEEHHFHTLAAAAASLLVHNNSLF